MKIEFELPKFKDAANFDRIFEGLVAEDSMKILSFEEVPSSLMDGGQTVKNWKTKEERRFSFVLWYPKIILFPRG